MARHKMTALNWFSTTMIALIAIGVVWFWVSMRGFPFNNFDLVCFLIGVFSFVWVLIWSKFMYRRGQTLFVPYSPTFIVVALGLLGGNFGYLSGIEFMNLMVFFLSGQFIMIPVIAVFNLIFGVDIYEWFGLRGSVKANSRRS